MMFTWTFARVVVTQWIADTLLDIKLWIDEADWRSWLAHSVVAVPIAALFGVVPVAVLFGVRELEQIALALAYEDEPHWLDSLVDVVAPVIAALLVVLVL